MSLYNMVNGFSPACLLLMPMLGRTQYEYPRFRDCFLSDDEQYIEILTRVGGGNRKQGYGEEELYSDPNFVKTYDWDQDSTYGFYVFKAPDKWKEDFDKIVAKKFSEVSDAYIECVKTMYPKLAAAGLIDAVFGRITSEEFAAMQNSDSEEENSADSDS